MFLSRGIQARYDPTTCSSRKKLKYKLPSGPGNNINNGIGWLLWAAEYYIKGLFVWVVLYNNIAGSIVIKAMLLISPDQFSTFVG